MQSFTELPLAEPIRDAVAKAGYTTPTPIQARAIPPLLEGRDLLGTAQTGTGKTAAFALPILHHLHQRDMEAGSARADDRSDTRQETNAAHRVAARGGRRGAKRAPARAIRSLVLTPTRELAAQIVDSFRTYGRGTSLRALAVYGGVGRQPQVQKIRAGVDCLVATPGRLLDLLDTGDVSLRSLEVFVLDEADRMLDMGFIHDVRRVIAALPARRQSLFFSATMPPAVAELAGGLLTDPVRVEVAPQSTPAERIQQSVRFVDPGRKDPLLAEILADTTMERVLVFTRTKHRADRVARKLNAQSIPTDAIHGNKKQGARVKALEDFRLGKTRVLVATDIAARGIDIDGITHVINYELPNEPESYVHRIGRTARAGADGSAISLCAGDERDYLKDIEKIMGRRIEVLRDHGHHSGEAERGLVDGVCGVTLRKEKLANKMRGRQGASQGAKGGKANRGPQSRSHGNTHARAKAPCHNHGSERSERGPAKGQAKASSSLGQGSAKGGRRRRRRSSPSA